MLETNTAPAGDNVPSVLVSIEDMQAQLAVAEEQAETLRREIASARQAKKASVIEEIKAQISDYGIEANELFAVSKTRTRKAKSAGTGTERGERAERVILRDTVTGMDYKGGKFPSWLKERLETTALEYPDSREQYMSRVN